MKKSAFTLIELIFVIVIIGVLASVAISKLNSTRTDARTATLTTNMQDGVKELVAYYTSQGGKVNFNDINASTHSSQIFFNELIPKGWAEIKDENHTVVYSNRDTKVVCVSYTTDGSQIEVETNSSNNDLLCQDIKRVMPADRNYSVLNHAVNF
jgi:prepilin-type N-terminal cleavage/methylation domain-containing protein